MTKNGQKVTRKTRKTVYLNRNLKKCNNFSKFHREFACRKVSVQIHRFPSLTSDFLAIFSPVGLMRVYFKIYGKDLWVFRLCANFLSLEVRCCSFWCLQSTHGVFRAWSIVQQLGHFGTVPNFEQKFSEKFTLLDFLKTMKNLFHPEKFSTWNVKEWNCLFLLEI